MIDSIFGFEPDPRTFAMMQTVARLSPKRPLRFNELSASHHASGGAEVFPDYLNIALRRNDINDKLLSHELANLLIELQHDYLAISDRIPRGTTDRRMIETLLSLFQHPEVFSIQREFGFDPRLANEKNFNVFWMILKRFRSLNWLRRTSTSRKFKVLSNSNTWLQTTTAGRPSRESLSVTRRRITKSRKRSLLSSLVIVNIRLRAAHTKS